MTGAGCYPDGVTDAMIERHFGGDDESPLCCDCAMWFAIGGDYDNDWGVCSMQIETISMHERLNAFNIALCCERAESTCPYWEAPKSKGDR